MRESAGRRLLFAMLLALAAGVLVHFYNPVDHIRADLHADAHGVKLSLEIAAHALEERASKAPDLVRPPQPRWSAATAFSISQ
jgi:hypothetical protein